MTPHEQQIRAHCKAHRIRIEVLPSGALRFTGYGVEVTAADVGSVTLMNLEPYFPASRQALRDDSPAYDRKSERGDRVFGSFRHGTA